MNWIRRAAVAFAIILAATAAHAQNGNLRIYFIDVEGGQSTLFVGPGGHSLLVDTGWAGSNNRDADRIVAAATEAGLKMIDTVLITHYHADHVGGVTQLAAKFPIGRFLDHGPNREQNPGVQKDYDAFQQVLADKHIPEQIMKPGDHIDALPGVQIDVISADGQVISKPLAAGGAGKPNPLCPAQSEKPIENTENDRSLGILLTFGKLRILDLGDLTWAVEHDLMCPTDKLGKIDVYVVSHHGLDNSGSPEFVSAIAPRIAIMDNGARKGGNPGAWEIIEHLPHLEGLWQLHTVETRGAHNVADTHIANLSAASGGPPQDAGYGLTLTAARDGSLTMLNPRSKQSVHYPPQ